MTMKRVSYIADRAVLLDSGVQVFDVNVNTPITSIWCLFEATNGATSNVANNLAQCIQAIELIDGSEVLYSLPGDMALALAAYQKRDFPYQGFTELPGNPWELNIPLYFGRWLDDESLAFDPTHFSNPQVRIRWNLAAVRAVGATGFVTGSMRVSLIAELLEGIAAPVGMLMSKVWQTWVTAVGATQYTPLPVDYPYRSMTVQAYLTGHTLDDVIDRWKIDCDNNKYVPIDELVLHSLFRLRNDGQSFHYRHVFHVGDTMTIYPVLKYEESVALQSEDLTDVVYQYNNFGMGEGAVRVFRAGVAFGAHTNCGAGITGTAPFSCIHYNFGEDSDPNTWFNPTLYKSVRSEIRGHQVAPASIALTQLRPY